VTILLVYSAVLAWHLGGVSDDTRRALSPALWAFALSYAAIASITWRYFFIAPGVFSTAIALTLALAAHAATRPERA
jgi:hypothetical protein